MVIVWPLSRFILSDIFCCKAARPIETKLHVVLLWIIVRMEVCSNSPGHVTKMATMPVYSKNTLKIFSKTRRLMTFIQTWYTSSGTRTLQSCLYDDPGLTLTYFTAWSTLLPSAFVWENVWILDFIQTIEDCELEVGTNSWLSVYMNTYEYQRSRSLFNLSPRLHRNILSDILLCCWTHQSNFM